MPTGKQMVVIGDTPHDISCGKVIGARTIAVASGPEPGMDALRASGPWLVLERLPDPKRFRELLGLEPLR
jgi:phosphoglycolate phosphatase